jgi:hypothetical protein
LNGFVAHGLIALTHAKIGPRGLSDPAAARILSRNHGSRYYDWSLEQGLFRSEPAHGSFDPAKGVRRRLRESRCELGFAG